LKILIKAWICRRLFKKKDIKDLKKFLLKENSFFIFIYNSLQKIITLLKINNNVIYLHDKMQIEICSSKYVINTILLDVYNLYFFFNK